MQPQIKSKHGYKLDLNLRGLQFISKYSCKLDLDLNVATN